MPNAAFRQQAFWLFGVIVGLAIKEALSAVLIFLTSTTALPDNLAPVPLQAWRLLIFIILIIRFYLGAALYFEEHYQTTTSRKGYVNDFLAGITHFILFYVLALTLRDPSLHTPLALSLFQTVLGFVLLFDVLWLVICRNEDGINRVRFWAFLNVATVVLGLLIHVCVSRFGVKAHWVEALSLIPVCLASFIDFMSMAHERPYVAEWLEKIIAGGKTKERSAEPVTPAKDPEPAKPE